MTNQFESFDSEKSLITVPDYVGQLKKRQLEEAEGDKLVEAQIKDNEKIRKANADQNAATWKSLHKLAPIAATKFGEFAQKQDEKYEARLSLLLNKAGIGWDEMDEFRKQDEENINFDTLGTKLANQQIELSKEEGADYAHHIALAEQFRSWGGRDAQRAGRLVLNRKANNLERDFNLVKDTLQLEDGTKWAGADPTQQEELWEKFLVDQGLRGVLPYNSVLKEDAFWKKANKTRDAVLKGESSKFLAAGVKLRKQNGVERIIEAGKYDAQTLFDTYNDVVNQTWADYNPQDEKTKREAKEAWWGEIKTGVINGDIPAQIVEDMLNMEVEHKGMLKADGTYKKVAAFTFFGFDAKEEIRDLRIKVAEEKEKDEGNLVKSYSIGFDKQVVENGGIIHEAEIEEALRQWQTNPETKHLAIPDSLKTWSTRTVEDEKDDLIIEFLEDQLDDPETPVDINRAYLIYDDKKREDMIKRIQGPEGTGISKAKITSINKSITKVVKGALDLDFGESGNTPEVENMSKSAYANYLKYYRDGRNQYESDAANHKQALDAVTAEINDGIHYEDQRGIDTSKGYSKKMNTIRSFVSKNPDTFLGMRLPGMNSDYKQLEAWAANHDRTPFPGIWAKMAEKYPVYEVVNGVRRKLSGDEWAQENYRNLYGKELPPITGPNADMNREIKSKPNYWNLSTALNKRNTVLGLQATENGTVDSLENTTVGVV